MEDHLHARAVRLQAIQQSSRGILGRFYVMQEASHAMQGHLHTMQQRLHAMRDSLNTMQETLHAGKEAAHGGAEAALASAERTLTRGKPVSMNVTSGHCFASVTAHRFVMNRLPPL